jgi:aspartyl-tRNA(Asn)/glutamyl-tRNA(Gln) amidotransferase subunit A
MATNPTQMTALELSGHYERRKLSPVEVAQAVIDRIDDVDGQINAYAIVDAEGAMEAARKSEKRWKKDKPLSPLDGVPVSIKELLHTKGMPTVMGSQVIPPDSQPWDYDAPSVARLREAGAVILGKTTSPEFGFKGVTDSPLRGITRNPWNPDKTPGGSSGGSGAAIAAGMGPLSVGTDGGGSIRIPSSFCGLVGMKATFGKVAAFPPSMHGTMANAGPMARTVEDCAAMLNVIAKPDARDWYALPDDGTDYEKHLRGGVRKLRIAFSPALGSGASVDPEVAKAVAKAAWRFEELGAKVEQVDAPVSGFDAGTLFVTHWLTSVAHLLKVTPKEAHKLFDPALVESGRIGERYSTDDLVVAQQRRRMLGHQYEMFFQKYDLLLTPTVSVLPFDVGMNAPLDAKGQPNNLWTPFTYVFNLTRQPAISIPCGVSKNGLPIGLQIVSGLYRDTQVLRAARAYTHANPVRLPHLPVAKASSRSA